MGKRPRGVPPRRCSARSRSLADAIHLADLAQRDYLGAVQHDQADAETIGRMLESARYAASLAKIALDSGLPLDHELPAGSVTLDTALSAVIPATTSVIDDVITALSGSNGWVCDTGSWRRRWLPMTRCQCSAVGLCDSGASGWSKSTSTFWNSLCCSVTG